MRIAIAHHTRYRFDRPVRLAPHEIRLRPAPHARTPVEGYALIVGPAPHLLKWRQDSAGNNVAYVVFQEPAAALDIDVAFETDLIQVNPFDFLLEPRAQRLPVDYSLETANLTPYLQAAEHGPLLLDFLSKFEGERTSGASTLDELIRLARHVAAGIAYEIRHDEGVQTCEQTLERARGSCRDSGWLLAQGFRHLGVAARFVSGYLIQLAGVTHAHFRDSADEKDRVDLHAWAEAYLPGAGWVGFDATSGLLTAEGHIPVAVAAAPEGAAPVTGSLEPSKVELAFEMKVTRLPAHA